MGKVIEDILGMILKSGQLRSNKIMGQLHYILSQICTLWNYLFIHPVNPLPEEDERDDNELSDDNSIQPTPRPARKDALRCKRFLKNLGKNYYD